MKSHAFESMSVAELFRLREQLTSILARKMEEEKTRLEERLRRLHINNAMSPDRPRRPYPKVLPKYQNPTNPAETWSGRGKRPHWVSAYLNAGERLDHLLINRSSIESRRQTG
jgi:DNA-binding protein H-NS